MNNMERISASRSPDGERLTLPPPLIKTTSLFAVTAGVTMANIAQRNPVPAGNLERNQLDELTLPGVCKAIVNEAKLPEKINSQPDSAVYSPIFMGFSIWLVRSLGMELVSRVKQFISRAPSITLERVVETPIFDLLRVNWGVAKNALWPIKCAAAYYATRGVVTPILNAIAFRFLPFAILPHVAENPISGVVLALAATYLSHKISQKTPIPGYESVSKDADKAKGVDRFSFFAGEALFNLGLWYLHRSQGWALALNTDLVCSGLYSLFFGANLGLRMLIKRIKSVGVLGSIEKRYLSGDERGRDLGSATIPLREALILSQTYKAYILADRRDPEQLSKAVYVLNCLDHLSKRFLFSSEEVKKFRSILGQFKSDIEERLSESKDRVAEYNGLLKRPKRREEINLQHLLREMHGRVSYIDKELAKSESKPDHPVTVIDV